MLIFHTQSHHHEQPLHLDAKEETIFLSSVQTCSCFDYPMRFWWSHRWSNRYAWWLLHVTLSDIWKCLSSFDLESHFLQLLRRTKRLNDFGDNKYFNESRERHLYERLLGNFGRPSSEMIRASSRIHFTSLFVKVDSLQQFEKSKKIRCHRQDRNTHFDRVLIADF